MPDTVAELAQRGRALGAKDRERLVDLLLDSLAESPDPAIEEAWRLEIRRRVAVYERGEAVLYDADEVMAEAKRLAP
jgi:putative addiction module component (TIGR02574 family)